ncbi:hypothetical protein [Nonomuraea jiangxiensis]|uniref:Uncharacterized protein n=1 Tax=Nonomuraea jiangxiensis TaxID=633440 RepID=A0A1G8C9G2_9ACTN|nr:hypothetical protein [Nonomuraea jiangxiensis]SDH41949.1 hypothetical protein SAMN05421869_102229 [Nonomuraea jiangxiensis]
MICDSCKDKRHEDCRGGSWCDCQHQTLSHEGHEGPTSPGERAEREREPQVNWLRQG